MRSQQFSFSYENPLKEKFPQEFFTETLPERPGVYFMLAEDESILYIGKAKCLRARVGSYRFAKPGHAPENVIEMLEFVSTIRWEEHSSEEKALAREKELLPAIRPPFNIAGTDPFPYLYLGFRAPSLSRGSPLRGDVLLLGNVANDGNLELPSVKLDLILTSRESTAGYELFGCFRDRRQVKSGYTALLRLAYCATLKEGRFSYPAKITRTSPPYLYSARFPLSWIIPLRKFLRGESDQLLKIAVESLLANEFVPRFMYPSVQEDIATLQAFYRSGPKANQRLRKLSGGGSSLLSQGEMDNLVARTLRTSST